MSTSSTTVPIVPVAATKVSIIFAALPFSIRATFPELLPTYHGALTHPVQSLRALTTSPLENSREPPSVSVAIRYVCSEPSAFSFHPCDARSAKNDAYDVRTNECTERFKQVPSEDRVKHLATGLDLHLATFPSAARLKTKRVSISFVPGGGVPLRKCPFSTDHQVLNH